MWKEGIGVSCLFNAGLQLHYFHQGFLHCEEDTSLYDLGKSLQERRPGPLIFKGLDLDTTVKENKFGWVSSLVLSQWRCGLCGSSEGHQTKEMPGCGGGEGDHSGVRFTL